ncbi:MAG: TonB-dependent receptor [Bacteroidetes bacterium]|nr:TonB-dependent receptor [Bacteroidota bacterium]
MTKTNSTTWLSGKMVSLFAFLFLALTVSGFAQKTVSGTVTDENGEALIGVTILVEGTASGVLSDESGRYSIQVAEGNTLVYSMVSFKTHTEVVGASNTINVTMEFSTLEEVVVTGYTSERKADIIGSVEVVNTEDMLTAPAGNLTGQLQGRASGVVVSNDSRPGNGAKVRIRGFTSFGASNPLYIIDGVPTKDPSTLNPNDIASVQVLKDATAASIYGARAAQGVIIVTTKGGSRGSMKISYDGYYGTQTVPQSSLPDVLNTQEYVEYLQKNNGPDFIHPVFGSMSSPTIPDKIVVSPGFKGGVSASDPRANSDLYDISNYGAAYQIMDVSDGTDWFDAALRPATIQNHQVTASGGTDKGTYVFSLNYFGQQGMYEYTDYNRYSARMNTSFQPVDWLRIGENFQFTYNKSVGNAGGGGTLGEGSPFAWAYRMVPYLPVYDIGGGFGGNAVGESGNATNPVAVLYRNKDDYFEQYKTFGNAFIEITPIEGLTIRSSFGIDYSNFFNRDITYRTYESSENTSITGFNNSFNYGITWTFTNTAAYAKSFGKHEIKLLAGTEAISYNGNGIGVSTNTFDFEDPNFINLNTDQFGTPSTSSNQPIPERLASYFGKIDYIFNNKYLVNATIRRDGTSKIYETERYGVFPAFGVGWRVSEESFMSGVEFIDDLKLRFGWGQMGSIDNVGAGNQFTLFGSNIGISNYDINRTNNGAVVGYTPYRAGSITTKWEVSETTNIGLDGSAFQGQLIFGFNYFINNTRDLIVSRQRNGLEPQVFQPAINLGQMQNKGFEVSLTNRKSFGDFEYDLTLLFTHYKNKVIDIDGNPESFQERTAARIGTVVRTSVGQPVSYFWGYEIDGFFNTEADLNALDQEGAVVGSWRFKDQNNDKVIDDQDLTILGSPHPDFVTSLNADLRYKDFDFNMFWIWNQGNELFNNNKYFTDMRVFVGGVSPRVLYEGWTPQNQGNGAVLPYLAPGAESGYTSFTRANASSYFVENGSYLRLRTMQIGYNLPANVASKLSMSNARIYVQGQNLFTLTGYSGPDPDINITGQNPGDDLKMGVDESGFPATRQILFGLNIGF